MKNVRRLSPIHAYQLGITVTGFIALAGMLLKAWTAIPAAILTLALGVVLGLGIDRIADPASKARRTPQASGKRAARAGKYLPKDGPGKGRTPKQSERSRSPTAQFLRTALQYTSSLPGQVLTVLVVTSLAFFVFIEMGGKSSLFQTKVSPQKAFFCGASVAGILPEEVDSSKLGEYDYELKEDTCRDFLDYVRELTQGSDSSEDEMRLEVCNLAQEAMMSSIKKIQHFEDIQFLISGDIDNLRAYNMDIYTASCAAP